MYAFFEIGGSSIPGLHPPMPIDGFLTGWHPFILCVHTSFHMLQHSVSMKGNPVHSMPLHIRYQKKYSFMALHVKEIPKIPYNSALLSDHRRNTLPRGESTIRIQIKRFKNLKPVKYCLFHTRYDPAKGISEK
jgi:hypothetical protein